MSENKNSNSQEGEVKKDKYIKYCFSKKERWSGWIDDNCIIKVIESEGDKRCCVPDDPYGSGFECYSFIAGWCIHENGDLSVENFLDVGRLSGRFVSEDVVSVAKEKAIKKAEDDLKKAQEKYNETMEKLKKF